MLFRQYLLIVLMCSLLSPVHLVPLFCHFIITYCHLFYATLSYQTHKKKNGFEEKISFNFEELHLLQEFLEKPLTFFCGPMGIILSSSMNACRNKTSYIWIFQNSTKADPILKIIVCLANMFFSSWYVMIKYTPQKRKINKIL